MYICKFYINIHVIGILQSGNLNEVIFLLLQRSSTELISLGNKTTFKDLVILKLQQFLNTGSGSHKIIAFFKEIS